MRAWHFVGDKLCDGRAVPADGVMLKHPGRPIICEAGLHASLRPLDALSYAPGSVLCLVECGGHVIHQLNKLVCTERTILARADATSLLRYFARQQALSVVHLWEPPQVVLDYLMGDEAAQSAAWSAARAAESAAWSAEFAAESAAWSAGWHRSAAWSAAESAAWSAAWSAGWHRSAAWSAAQSAAWSAAGEMFDVLVFECFEDFL